MGVLFATLGGVFLMLVYYLGCRLLATRGGLGTRSDRRTLVCRHRWALGLC